MEHQIFFGFGSSREFGGFFKGSPWSGYLAYISSATLGGLLGKIKFEYMDFSPLSLFFTEHT
jgi:hypothetical protein